MRSGVASDSASRASSAKAAKRSIRCTAVRAQQRLEQLEPRFGGRGQRRAPPAGASSGSRQRRAGAQVRSRRAARISSICSISTGVKLTTARAAGFCLQVRGHVGVVLDRVQVGPGQDVLARQRVAVLRLVHVPHQHDRESVRHRVGTRGRGRHRAGQASSSARKQACDRHGPRSMSGVTSTTPFSVSMKRCRVGLGIDADLRSRRNLAAFVEDRVADRAAARRSCTCGRITA